MAALHTTTLPHPYASDVSDLVDNLARAKSNEDQTRVAARGLQRLLHARVAVSTGGSFRAELRDLVASALLVPRSHQPLQRHEPEDRPGSLLISAGPRRRIPAYLLWRAEPFSLTEILVADGLALAVVALHLRWEAIDATDLPHCVPAPEAPGLTSREAAILEHLAQGLSAEGIARVAGISPRTVRKHLQHVYAKLGAHDRLVAVETARAAGILTGGHGGAGGR